jgi:hypothetical protein
MTIPIEANAKVSKLNKLISCKKDWVINFREMLHQDV